MKITFFWQLQLDVIIQPDLSEDTSGNKMLGLSVRCVKD